MNNNNNKNSSSGVFEIDLLEFMQAVFRNLWIVIILALVFAGMLFAYAKYMVTPMYQTDAMIYVNNNKVSLGNIESVISSSDISAAKSLVNTYIVILNSRTTLQKVIDESGVNRTIENLQQMISAKAVENTEIFRITVKTESPAESTLIANTICKVLPDSISNVVDGSSVRIVDYAVSPTKRCSPSYTKYTFGGLAIGIVAGLVYIFIYFVTDDIVHNGDDIASGFDIPLLAGIPDLSDEAPSKYTYYETGVSDGKKHKKKDRSGKVSMRVSDDRDNLAQSKIGDALSFAASESYKLLRTNLGFCLPVKDEGDSCRVIGITSATQGEGKSLTSVNLSYSLAEAGYKTLLIECDMRLPTLAKRLGIQAAPGLSNLVAGFTDGSCIQKSGLRKRLSVITSGDIPPNPSELLTGERMAIITREFSKYYDYIILDLPPVNIVADALTVSRLADGIILVVREDYSEKRGVKDAVEKFKFSQTNILGFVLTCAGVDTKGYYSKSGRRYRKYSYGVGYARYRYSRRHSSGYGGYSYGYDRSAGSYKESADQLRAQLEKELKEISENDD